MLHEVLGSRRRPPRSAEAGHLAPSVAVLRDVRMGKQGCTGRKVRCIAVRDLFGTPRLFAEALCALPDTMGRVASIGLLVASSALCLIAAARERPHRGDIVRQNTNTGRCAFFLGRG